MSIEQADDFSIYGTILDLLTEGIYAETVTLGLGPDPDGVSTGDVISFGILPNNTASLRYVLHEDQATVGIAERFYTGSLPQGTSYSQRMMVFLDESNSRICYVQNTTTGRLAVFDSTNTLIAQTDNPVITAKAWWHIEMKVTQSGTPSGSTVEVRVEGVTVISEDNVTLPNTNSIAQVAVQNVGDGSGGGIGFAIKDFVVWNGSGSQNTDFLGSVLVTNLTPTADIDLNWTPSAGSTGFNILNQIPPGSDYIDAPNPPPSPYICKLSALPADVTSVKALITFVRVAKTDGGDGSLQNGLISDPLGTPETVLGADRPITVAQTYWCDVFEEDPSTSAPWLPSSVNAVNLQINRTT